MNTKIKPALPHLAGGVGHGDLALRRRRRQRHGRLLPHNPRGVSLPRWPLSFFPTIGEPPRSQELVLAEHHGDVDGRGALHERQKVVGAGELRRRFRGAAASASGEERAEEPPDSQHAQQAEDGVGLRSWSGSGVGLVPAACSSWGRHGGSGSWRRRHWIFLFCFMLSTSFSFPLFFLFFFFLSSTLPLPGGEYSILSCYILKAADWQQQHQQAPLPHPCYGTTTAPKPSSSTAAARAAAEGATASTTSTLTSPDARSALASRTPSVAISAFSTRSVHLEQTMPSTFRTTVAGGEGDDEEAAATAAERAATEAPPPGRGGRQGR